MRRVRSLSNVQARAQHVPRARFVAHANLSFLLLASDEIDRLYSQVQLPIIQLFFKHFTAFKRNCIPKNRARKQAFACNQQRACDLLIERSVMYMKAPSAMLFPFS